MKCIGYAVNEPRRQLAERLDGSHVLNSDRTDLGAGEAWRTYHLLTRAENAFRCMKSPLAERPIFHQVQRRVETQIFLCVLAQYLLVAIENTRLDQGVHTSWASVRDSLATHHIVTIVLPTDTGATLRIRKGSTPESEHQRTLSTARRQRTNRAAEEIWSETGASPVHPPQLRDFTRANEIIRQFSPILGIHKSPRNGLPSIVRPCIRERTGRHRHAGFQRDISQGRVHAADAGAVA